MASLSHSFSLSGARGRLFREGQEEKEVAQIEEALGKEWFAITAFPLIAGTFGPIATALNICAMVESWLCRTAEPFGLGVPICVAPIRDPGWLMGLNAVSLFFGTIANLVIMLVNSSSWLAQHDLELVLANIICGYLSSLILVALVIALHFRRVLFVDREEEGPIAYAQAYFYGIMAAGLYFVTSTFVIYTASMIRRSHRKRDDLAKSFANGSRSLKILVIILMGYMLIGASIYHHIEGWSYLNAVFWVDVTILTVGFGGEFVPRTHLGKSLLFPFATIGVFIVMMVIYCTTQVVLDRGSSQWEVRIRDKKRREVRDQRDGHSHSRSSSRNKERSCTLTNPSTWFNRKIDTEFDDLSPNATREKSLQVGPRRSRREEDRLQRQRDFESMQKILKHSQHRRILLSICVWSLFALFLWLFGAVIFWFCEKDQHWSYFEAVYFTFISILTIGYGDNNLNSASGKSVFVLWSLLVVPTLTILISSSTQGIGLPSFQRMKSFWFWKSSKNGPKLSKSLSIYAASNVVPDSLPHNNHDKNHLLVRAIKSIARDHIRNQQTGKRADYSFDDWEYISYLMGSLDVPEERNRNGTNESEGSTSTRRRRRSGWQDWHEGGEPGVLDWLDLKNPLNVNEVLTEWMLLGLVERLEGELRELRRELGNVPLEEEEESTS